MTITEPGSGNEYGMRAVAEWIEEDDLPLTTDDLRGRFGDRRIMLAFDTTVEFDEVLAHVEDEEYGTLTEMWAGLGDGFRAVDPRRERYEA